MARGIDDPEGPLGAFPTYVPVAARRQRAAALLGALKLRGQDVAPVVVEGKKIAATFWGSAWCTQLEEYSDYATRLPRGRSYVRNGSVVDLQIRKGVVTAKVQGSSLYEVDIEIDAVDAAHWARIVAACAGQIASVVELLKGRLSASVMSVVTAPGTGLFPTPSEIHLHCSCPDGARMCKHVAASLYGVGARLDHAPDLLFTLRGVEVTELVASAASRALQGVGSGPPKRRGTADLSSIFGIELDLSEPTAPVAEMPPALPEVAAPIVDDAPIDAKPLAPVITRAGLRALGLSAATIDAWKSEGVLVTTSQPNVFRHTDESRARIARHRA